MALPENPITRKETYLAKIAGQEVQLPDVPITREEAYLNEIAKSGGGGGGYVLPTATADRLGGVKIGSGISVEEDGTISASGGGTTDYDDLDNHPSINNVELSGNKTASDLGLQDELTFDNVPTDGSDNPVKSGGVYASDEAIRQWTTSEAKSVSGNPITLLDGSARKAEGLSVECNPKQNLHGYDHPWAGGAGKNKLPMTVDGIKSVNTNGTWNGNTYTHVNGVKVTILTDDDNNVIGFELNETTNGEFQFRLSPLNVSLPSGNYIWSIQNTINLDGLWVSIYEPNSVAIIAKTATSANYTCNGTFGGGYIYSNSGNTFNNIIIKPMLRLATESDPTFEPYSNECPITGYDECVVDVKDEDETTHDTATTTFGQTIYGAIVNPKTGKVTIDKVMKTFDDSSLTWSYQSMNGGFFECELEQSPNYTGNALQCEIYNYGGYNISNAAMQTAPDQSMYKRYDIGLGTNANKIRVKDSRYTDTTTWLASVGNYKFIYELATPIELTLTPAELELLKGYNYISTNGTTIALDYLPDSLFAEIKNYVDAKIPPAPTTDGTYILTCTVTDGTPAYTWESAT